MNMLPGTELFGAEGLVFGYQKDQPLLDHIDLDLQPGLCLGLSGKNGSGKTSLFRCLTGLNKIWSGEIKLRGQPIKTEKEFAVLRKNVGFAVQNAEDQLFFATVLEDVSFGPLNLGMSQEEARERGRHWLEKTGLAGMEDMPTFHLSGGQQKLLALAGIFAMEPAVLLLDEPFNGLDETATRRITALLAELPAAMLVVCHDHGLLNKICDGILQLEGGKLRRE